MNGENKLCINTGAVVSFEPEDLTTSCLLLFLKSKLLNMEEQIYKLKLLFDITCNK